MQERVSRGGVFARVRVHPLACLLALATLAVGLLAGCGGGPPPPPRPRAPLLPRRVPPPRSPATWGGRDGHRRASWPSRGSPTWRSPSRATTTGSPSSGRSASPTTPATRRSASSSPPTGCSVRRPPGTSRSPKPKSSSASPRSSAAAFPRASSLAAVPVVLGRDRSRPARAREGRTACSQRIAAQVSRRQERRAARRDARCLRAGIPAGAGRRRRPASRGT